MLQRGERKICHAATFEEQEFLWPLIAAKNKEKRKKKKDVPPPKKVCKYTTRGCYPGQLFQKRRNKSHTWRHSAALRKELRDSWDTCTSPRYMNSRRDAILWALVPSRITIRPAGEAGIPSNSSWKCLLHAARINLCALNVTPETHATIQVR